jgi:CBS domain-containing protein
MYRFLESRVADYMTRSVCTVTPETSVGELERLFVERDFNGLPVLIAGALAGMVTKFDVLKVFIFTAQSVLPHYRELLRRTAGEIMTRDVISFTPDTPLTRVLQTLVDARVKSFPVVENGKVVGIVAREDVVRALRDAAQAAGA